MIEFEIDSDTCLYVLVAVNLRIQDLKKIEAIGRSMSLCGEQLEGLEKFSDLLRRKMLDYEKSDSTEGYYGKY